MHFMKVFRHQYGQKGVALILMGILLFSLLPFNASNAQTDNPHAGITGGQTVEEVEVGGGQNGGTGASGNNEDSTISTQDLSWLERQIFELVVGAFGWLAILGGQVMDFGINTFVREYGSYYNNTFGGAIEIVWEAVRDLMNLLLIFGLIYIGFRFILDSDDSGAKRNLVTILIAALLVNFSLFFAKAIVDVSHVTANSFEEVLSDSTGDGVSGRFVNVLNLSAVFDLRETESGGVGLPRGLVWGSIFMIAISLLISAFVFAAIGVLLAIRFIVISFLLMFSPFMVLGMIFPNMSGLSNSWLQTLLKQSFIAPAIFLTLYVSLLILASLETQMANHFVTHTSEALPFYVLGMGFIIGSLVIAQKMGGYGASGAMSMGRAGAKKLRLTVQRGAVGGVRMAGRSAAAGSAAAARNTIGRRSYNKLNDERQVSKMSDKEFATHKARAESSYDPRQIGKWWKDTSSLNVQKGGVSKQIKDAQKLSEEKQEAMKELDPTGIAFMDDEQLEKLEKAEGIKGLSQKAQTYRDTTQDIENIKNELETATGKEKQTLQSELKTKQQKLKTQESSLRFARQLAAIEKEEGQVKKRNTKLAAAAGGGLAGTAVGTAAGVTATGISSAFGLAAATGAGVGASIPAGILVANNVAARHHRDKEVVANLRKKYGTDGTPAAQRKRTKESAEAQVAALKDSGVDLGGQNTAKDDEDSNENKT